MGAPNHGVLGGLRYGSPSSRPRGTSFSAEARHTQGLERPQPGCADLLPWSPQPHYSRLSPVIVPNTWTPRFLPQISSPPFAGWDPVPWSPRLSPCLPKKPFLPSGPQQPGLLGNPLFLCGDPEPPWSGPVALPARGRLRGVDSFSAASQVSSDDREVAFYLSVQVAQWACPNLSHGAQSGTSCAPPA